MGALSTCCRVPSPFVENSAECQVHSWKSLAVLYSKVEITLWAFPRGDERVPSANMLPTVAFVVLHLSTQVGERQHE